MNRDNPDNLNPDERCPACGAAAHWPEAREGFGFYDEATGTSVDDFGCPSRRPEPENQPVCEIHGEPEGRTS